MSRHHVGWAARAAVALVAATATGAAVEVLLRRGQQRRRAHRGEDIEFGSLHSRPLTVTADDGVPLCVEVDELENSDDPAPLTIVFVHGWLLDLDCWHYQRAAFRGDARLVFYDQRSHGRSGRSPAADATLDQLGRDLHSVIENVAPAGPVVLVGHSMGGMTIMKFAEQFPELMRERVVAVALCATSAGDLVRHGDRLRRLDPVLQLGLPRLTPLVNIGRHYNHYAVARRYAVGPNAPEKYADMTDEMLMRAPTRLFWDFLHNFGSLDAYDALTHLPGERTLVVGGTKDQITPYRHSRRMSELIKGSRLLTLVGVGHMVMLESHVDVNEALAQLVEDATGEREETA